MRSLEICTQKFFNNLTKQNQKMVADFVLKQRTIVSSAQSPASKVQRPTSSVQRPGSRVQRPGSSVQSPTSRVQRLESSVQSPAFRVQYPESRSRVQSPASRVQRPESSVQSPASNIYIQNPGIPVCLFNEKAYGMLECRLFLLQAESR